MAAALLATAPAFADDGKSMIGSTILVGSELDYPPYASVDKAGHAAGYSVDLIRAVARQVGLKLDIQLGPWSEIKGKLQRGELDVLPLVAYSVERDQYFDFSTPHIISHASVFVRKEHPDLQTLDDLRGKEVIVMRGDSSHEYVSSAQVTQKIFMTDTVGEALMQLSSGKHDFVVVPKLSGLLLLQELEIDNIEPFGPPLEAYGKGYAFAVRAGNAELLALLEQGLVLVRASGEYNRIYDKWFGHVDPHAVTIRTVIRNTVIVVVILLLIMLIGFAWNILLRRQIASRTAELKLSEKRFSATFAEAAIGLAHVAPDGSWLRVNQRLCDIVGYREEELLKLNFKEITHPDDLDKDLHFVEQMLSGDIETYSTEKRYFRKNGSVVWVQLTVSLMHGEDGGSEYFISAIEDISSRKKLDALLLKERDLAQKYLDVAGVMLLALDDQGKVTLINREGLKILGYQEHELVGNNWFNTCLPPHKREEVAQVYSRLMLGEVDLVRYYENIVLTRSGEERLVAFYNTVLYEDERIVGILSSGEDITGRRQIESRLKKMSRAIEQAGEAVVITDAKGTIEYINAAFTRITGYSAEEVIGENPRILKSGKHDRLFYDAMWQRITSGKVWQGRVIDKRKDGSLYPALVTISPLRDADGAVTNYVGVQQSLKKYEDLEKQFHQSQKMEAIGTLVGGIAHDFNNSLAGITGNLYLARQKASEPEIQSRIDSAERLAFSAASIIQQLLTFSRKGVVNMSTLSITPFLKEFIKLHRVSIPENIALHQYIDELGLKVHGDINQLQQAMMNLLNNARDAVEHVASPEIVVSLSRESVVETGLSRPEQLKGGEYACISVADNGCGISDDIREHIFEPFFTTKPEGKGTGLGLAMVYGAVKMHGGWIYATAGEGGVGTVIKIYLPLVHAEESKKPLMDSDNVLNGQGETILLVDDNAMVLETGKEVLEGLGYRVLSATDGLEAVEIYVSHGHDIDLLLLDMIMPRLGGIEAFKQIRASNPDVKVIFATGYNKLNAAAQSSEFQAMDIISKPFSISELSQLIRMKLESD